MNPKRPLSLLLLLAPVLTAGNLRAQEPAALDARLTEVTVYSGAASVKYRATAPAGGGTFVLADLSPDTDPAAVRVKAVGAEVLGVELRDRFKKDVPEARVVEIRARIQELERTERAQRDEDHVLALVDAHLEALLRHEESAHAAELQRGSTSVEAWGRNFAFIAEGMQENRAARRELAKRIEATQRALQDARLELGSHTSGAGVHVFDLHVELAATSADPIEVEVDTIVGNCGWTPAYDLRAPKDLSSVELVYRAQVWQRTGTDWRDVDVLLSTAQPQRGAQGPEPMASWLSLRDPRIAERSRGRREVRKQARPDDARLGALGYAGAELMEEMDLDALAFASVSQEGISVRYRLPRKETIESRNQPTTVLVGRADLDVTPEHRVVPALDTTVWLRARTRNTSDWILLPGRAAVYFGADFLGHANLGSVQRDEEFTLHLGPDPGLVVERTQIEDLTEKPGLFSSKKTRRQTWRIRLANHGAFTPLADGRVAVIVQETLPQAKDERIEVKVERASPPLATAARWAKEREEDGTLTWLVTVPRGGEARVELVTEIRWPEDLNLVER